MEVILDCTHGSISDGIISIDHSFSKKRLFVDEPKNILGFRRYVKHYYDESINCSYFEVGYFMEMLHSGSIEAFEILTTNEDFINFKSLEFDIIRKETDSLVSMKLFDNLMAGADKNYNLALRDEGSLSKNVKFKKSQKYSVEILGYNADNAYIAFKYLNLALDLIAKGEFDMSNLDTLFLQGIKDGRISKKGISEAYEKVVKEIEKVKEDSDLRLSPSEREINEILMEVRNVEVRSLNIER